MPWSYRKRWRAVLDGQGGNQSSLGFVNLLPFGSIFLRSTQRMVGCTALRLLCLRWMSQLKTL